MDRYIAATKHGVRDTWWSTPSEHQRTSGDADFFKSQMDNGIADMSRRSSVSHSDIDGGANAWHNDMDGSTLRDVQRQRIEVDSPMESVSSSNGQASRRQRIEVDSPMESVARSSAQAPPPHGAVVDIKLDSELQMRTKKKGVAKNGLRFMQAGAHSAPNVENAVAEQQLEDVYIHDDFSDASNSDVEEENSIKDNPELKP